MSDIFETDIDDEAENLASLEDGDVGIAPTEKIVFDYPLYHLKLEYSCETIYAKTPEKMELKPGDFVVTPTRYGKDMAKVLGTVKCPMGIKQSDIVQIDRKASAEDLKKREELTQKEKDAAAREFEETLKSRYPNVAALTVKMTYDDYLRLLLRWPIEMVREKLAEMNRYPKISEYVDAYRTCIKWLQIEKKRIEKDGRWDIYQKKVEEQKQQVMKFITKK